MKYAMVPLYYENMTISLWKYTKNTMIMKIIFFGPDLPFGGYAHIKIQTKP